MSKLTVNFCSCLLRNPLSECADPAPPRGERKSHLQLGPGLHLKVPGFEVEVVGTEDLERGVVSGIW